MVSSSHEMYNPPEFPMESPGIDDTASRTSASSYFSSSHRSSFSSSTSSITAATDDDDRVLFDCDCADVVIADAKPDHHHQGAPARAATGPITQPPTARAQSSSLVIAADALSREFPAPADDGPPLDELLARPPLRWSLGHYLKHAREARRPSPDDRAREAQRFAEAKDELRRARDELRHVVLPFSRRR